MGFAFLKCFYHFVCGLFCLGLIRCFGFGCCFWFFRSTFVAVLFFHILVGALFYCGILVFGLLVLCCLAITGLLILVGLAILIFFWLWGQLFVLFVFFSLGGHDVSLFFCVLCFFCLIVFFLFVRFVFCCRLEFSGWSRFVA
ncbi:hypothetical protein SAMN04487969_104175 [Paenibacillus algorifonticola]|uniref:Uncharacterized protein n=1 Tax=Paenibacillus algorifonticola TaxID=684063 RepID=A0A1I2C1S4_9BACL|nr:hypothetical protein SAMN04487969_104175 [Paenibacillus algorifonticola]